MKAIKKELQKKAQFALMRYKEEHHLTQEELAEELGVTRVTVGHWLIGKQNFSGPMLRLFQIKGILK